MLASRVQLVVLSAMVAACAAFATGCYAEVDGEQGGAVTVQGYDGYAPQYYDGYVVYYDGYGRPYYYNNGGTYYVPRGYAHYDGLVRHYQTYREPYGRWHSRYGSRYRTYRRR
jgi:hypothetical protein